MVASIISAMVSNPRFADAIKAKIGSAVDTNDLEKQLEALQAQLRQTLGTKARLERQMDGLDVNDPYYDRKISDLQRRYDEQYGAIDEIEVQIDDVQSQIRSIRQEKISGDNIYRLLLAFDQVYEAASEVERKEFMRAFIERIELFPERQPDGNWIRKIIFNFPVPVNGTEVKELPLENETMVETVVLLTKEAPKKGNFIGEVSGEKRDIDTAFGIQQKVLEEINTLAEKYKIDKVILFGSRARGDYKEVSDIDLAVSGGDVNEFTLAVDAETSTLLEYDVVNLDGSVQEELRKSIEREGKMLYEKI